MPDFPSDTSDPAVHDIPYRDEVKRKGIHLVALVVPLGMALLGRTWALLILIPSALLALAADVLRAHSAAFARVIRRLFGPMMRMDEWRAPGEGVSINGATWVLCSAALLVLVFPLGLAVYAFVMFMISDAAAALVGRRFGHVHWGRSARTVEGSLAFLIVGLVITACFPDLGFWIGALAVAGTSVAEALPLPFDDNLHAPFTAAAIVALLEWLVLGHPVDLFF